MYNVLRQRNKQNAGTYLADLCFHCFTIMLKAVYTVNYICVLNKWITCTNTTKNECRCSQSSNS